MECDDVISPERKNWYTNTKVLYEFIACCNTPSQVLSLESLPLPHGNESKGICSQYIATGSNAADGEDNYITIYNALIPCQPLDEELKQFSNCLDYDGFPVPELQKEGICAEVCKIEHQGEVNRLVSSSPDIGILSSQTNSGKINLYKLTDFEFITQLNGSTEEGFGLSFYKNDNKIAGSFNDGIVKCWDLNTTDTTFVYKHSDGVNSVVALEDSLVAATEDGSVLIFDEKSQSVSLQSDNKSTNVGPINSIAANGSNKHLLVTGSTRGKLHFWDIRKISTPVHMINAHNSSIIRVEFNQYYESLLASASEDGSVQIFNMDNSGTEVIDEDSQEVPEEIIFSHSGHQDAITDFVWSYHHPCKFTIFSSAQDNSLQFWQPSNDAVIPDDEDQIHDSDIE